MKLRSKVNLLRGTPVTIIDVVARIEVVMIITTTKVEKVYQILDAVDVTILFLEVILIDIDVILANEIILIRIIFRIVLDGRFNVITMKILATDSLNVDLERV